MTPFTFGIPLIARTATTDWGLVQDLLALTLCSIGAQTQRDFRIVVAGHDRPETTVAHEFLRADWSAGEVQADNLDSGRKKHAIGQHVLASGGGLLMFVDADDWIDRKLVAVARASIGGDQVGGLIERGFATNLRSLQACPLPHPGVFAEGFHKLCGSSTVALLRPDHPDPVRRDPTAVLHEHYRWEEVAAEHDLRWAKLDVVGTYVVGTSVNHSESHGPFAGWRRSFNAAVDASGTPVNDAFLARFGLDLAQVRATRDRLAEECLRA